MQALQFSFKVSYLKHILRNSRELFPGATRVISYCYDPNIPGTIGHYRDLENNDSEIHILDSKELASYDLDNFRKQRTRFSWTDQGLLSSLPSEEQLKISGEFKNHTLIIRFPNKSDAKSDLLIIYFKNEEHVFRISEKQQKLSTELKHSLASVYVRNLDVIRKQIEEDNYIDELLRSHRETKADIENELRNEIKKQKEKQGAIIKSIATHIIKRSSAIEDFQIEWSEEALAYLYTHFSDYDQMEKSIEKALIIAINEGNNERRILIEASHVLDEKLTKNQERDKEISIRYQRTLTILDRYEEAASELINKRERVTGSNLGMQLQPPISAAAISDAIRKHSSKITHLLNQHPERWSILRAHFKPIQNKSYRSVLGEQLAS